MEHPEIPQRILFQDPLFFLAPGGETFAAFQGRVVARSRSCWPSIRTATCGWSATAA